MSRAAVLNNSFNAERGRDVPVRQRRIGRELRRRFHAVVRQQVPEQMIDLLRQAEARAPHARYVRRSKTQSSEISSVTIAMVIVASLVALYLVFDVAWLTLTQPATAAFVGFVALFFALASGAVWLIEGE